MRTTRRPGRKRGKGERLTGKVKNLRGCIEHKGRMRRSVLKVEIKSKRGGTW